MKGLAIILSEGLQVGIAVWAYSAGRSDCLLAIVIGYSIWSAITRINDKW